MRNMHRDSDMFRYRVLNYQYDIANKIVLGLESAMYFVRDSKMLGIVVCKTCIVSSNVFEIGKNRVSFILLLATPMCSDFGCTNLLRRFQLVGNWEVENGSVFPTCLGAACTIR